MNAKQRLIEQVGRSTRIRVINELKRTSAGLPVRDLAERLRMSYMGVKEVCLDLEKRGMLDTWRHPGKMGRPQMLYRLTPRAHELFPTASNSLTLDLLQAAQKLFGASAAEKLLFVAYQQKAAELAGHLRGETLIERAASLSKLRDAEGYMCELREGESGLLQLVEHHSPVRDVLQAFPIVGKLEAEMFQRLLGTEVHREVSGVSGLFCATFSICDPENGERT